MASHDIDSPLTGTVALGSGVAGSAAPAFGTTDSAAPTLVPTPDGFLRRGEPHVIISGAIHYFRVHPEQWRDRLKRLVAMGCDTVETYVAWNVHQPSQHETTFEGIADLGLFLDIAAEEGLDAIVRPGPYICAEWENGGFPGWLLRDPAMPLRNRDERYLRHVDSWFDQLIPVIAERQAARGGNVVMVQVENEYGSYGDDTAYLEHLRDGLRARGITELLVTSDGPARMWLTGGVVDGALATVNFGSRTLQVLDMAAEELPDQPQMCMEFWNGWFDHWGEEHHTRDAASAASELSDMLTHRMSVNFYMAHGGTNFGLSAGANDDGTYGPTTTSYDYDAPIAENGELTEKFHAFREVIAQHRQLPTLEEHCAQLGIEAVPARLPARELALESVVPFRGTELFQRTAPVHPVPPAFEEAGLERGIMRLARDIEITRNHSAEGDDSPAIDPLRLYGLHDRAWVYVDGIHVDTVQRGNDPVAVNLADHVEALLPKGGRRTVRVEILVESLGRTNFGPRLGERKGILGGVWQIIRYLNDWEVDTYPLEGMADELRAALDAGTSILDAVQGGDADPRRTLPVLIASSFEADEPTDTYLDVSAAGHGVAWVNGFCVGRYWSVGPQQSLYVPAPVVTAGRNEVLLLELEQVPERLGLVERMQFGGAGTGIATQG